MNDSVLHVGRDGLKVDEKIYPHDYQISGSSLWIKSHIVYDNDGC